MTAPLILPPGTEHLPEPTPHATPNVTSQAQPILCPHGFTTHLLGLQPRGPGLVGGQQEVDPLTTNTVLPCAGKICGVWNREKNRCGHITPSAEEIAQALAIELGAALQPLRDLVTLLRKDRKP